MKEKLKLLVMGLMAAFMLVACIQIESPENGDTVVCPNIGVSGSFEPLPEAIFGPFESVTVNGVTATYYEVEPGVYHFDATLTEYSAGPLLIIARLNYSGGIIEDFFEIDFIYIDTITPTIWYVDDTATGNNDGTSWDDAFTVIQDAADVASSGEWIWVAEGAYINSPSSTIPVLTMKAGVKVFGGFVGDESDLSERGDPAANETKLDGEDTSYHVVVGASNARLDGFIVTGGNANHDGGGMLNKSVNDLVVINCTFSDNQADQGGGMYNYQSSLTITNCTFSGNSGREWGVGGGMFNWYSSPTITNCTFSENYAELGGGGMYTSQSSPTITNCIFSDNSAIIGGGMNNAYSDPTITNCSFIGNSASEYGGGILNDTGSSPEITNCVFSDNSAKWSGGGMYNVNSWLIMITNCTFSGNSSKSRASVMEIINSVTTITNCIFWGNTTNQGQDFVLSLAVIPTILNINYSDVQGGEDSVYVCPGCTVNWDVVSMIEANPLFVSGPDGDYYLSQIAAGQGADSPCVDAGSDTAANLGLDDKTTRTDGLPDTGIVDMGYHYEP